MGDGRLSKVILCWVGKKTVINYHTIHLLCAAGVFTARLFLDLSSTSASLSSLPFFIFIDKPDATLLKDFEMPEEFKI